jgi:isopentenyl diphosphate isomerase/L-lactate dehydrogenase-like FMN-dependent dehydrogenase
MIEIYRREIDRVMGLCGLTRLADISRDLLFNTSLERHR